MPPKAPVRAPPATLSDSDAELVQQELADLLERMRRTTNDRRRKKREQLGTSHAQELLQLETDKKRGIAECHKAAIRHRVELIGHLKAAVEQKRAIEIAITDILKEIEEKTSNLVKDVRRAGGLDVIFCV